MPETECPVCFGNEWLTTTPCQHTICLHCLLQLRKDECPSCRSKIWYALPQSLQSLVAMPHQNKSKPRYQLDIYNHDEFPSLR